MGQTFPWAGRRSFDDHAAKQRGRTARVGIPGGNGSRNPIALLPEQRAILSLSVFAAVSAVAGGAALVASAHGNRFFPFDWIEHTPFASFLCPGFILTLVVGGSSLACATLVFRRSRYAIDATIFAGGALTVWIVAEVAILRELHWLHVVYGLLGAAILGLGVRAGSNSGEPRHRWVISVTLAEAVGFLFPACAGIVTTKAGLGDAPQAALLAAAGCIEGLALGAGQARAFPLPVRRLRYAWLTSLGAGIVWSVVMGVSALARSQETRVLPLVAISVFAGFVGLSVIGAVQWVELRHHTRGAGRWIGWTAAAWAVALPWSFAAATFVDESTPLASHVALWGSGGLIMAYVMAAMTWQGARRLVTLARPS